MKIKIKEISTPNNGRVDVKYTASGEERNDRLNQEYGVPLMFLVNNETGPDGREVDLRR